jgi:hypothetical protein
MLAALADQDHETHGANNTLAARQQNVTSAK